MLSEEKLKQECENAIKWVKEYVEKSHAKGIVVGLSGGKDSAVSLAIAVNAIGKENVVGISMPCSSIASDHDDAKLVADKFGVRFITVDLGLSYNEFENSINSKIGELGVPKLIRESKINIKPRLRMTTLYAVAQSLGYLVCGTGNLCEAMVGYTTKWGDSAADFNPIANFTVAEVLAIGKMLGVPDRIIEKAPNDGLGGQTDEEKMGVKYAQIEEMIETGKTDPDAEKIILARHRASEHKRNPIPVFEFERENKLASQSAVN